MSYIEQNLSSGETVLYRTRLHWIVVIAPCFAAVVMAALGVGLLVAALHTMNQRAGNSGAFAWTGAALLVAAGLVAAVAFWKRSATEMAVTNRRVLVKIGIVSRRSIEIMLSKIESIRVDQSLTGRMFNFGTIVLRGTGGTPEPFEKIAQPLEFRRRVQEQIDQLSESRTPVPSV